VAIALRGQAQQWQGADERAELMQSAPFHKHQRSGWRTQRLSRDGHDVPLKDLKAAQQAKNPAEAGSFRNATISRSYDADSFIQAAALRRDNRSQRVNEAE
jgi:hypothetical protein